VYVTICYIDNIKYDSITNIGTKPTVKNSDEITIETFIFDFNGDLYQKCITIELVDYLRSEIHFDNLELLKNQITDDVKKAKIILENMV
ncbi:MAG: riboflavin kinase, partial [Erysipelotrichaceae bacterium]